MNNDEQKLDSLTNQTVTISLGGKSYTANRASLYDVGLMNKERKRILDSGDSANADMEATFYLLYVLMKPYQPAGINNAEDLAKSIPFENYQDVIDSLAVVGFKMPQKQIEEAMKGTGA
jgi:hypothetical protein